jgi:RNA polymerase sigma-70 factor (ECF subfamily)
MKTSGTCNANKHSDSELVAAAKHRDAQAFEELVLRHTQRVLAIAQRITNNREDAEDVAQESFHKAYLHLDAFQEKSRFSTWLTRIVMNEAFMMLRRKRGVFEVLPKGPDDDAMASAEAFVDESSNPEESCWQRERTDLLAKAIHHLSPKIRRTILLRDIEEKSVEETAQILGTSISAVKARAFQGRRKLRRIVNAWLPAGESEYGRAQAQP